MPRTPKGFLKRRHSGRYVNIDDPKHQDATIYFDITAFGHRQAVCMWTSDKKTATRRAAKWGTMLKATDEAAYLAALVRLGKWAERRMNTLLG